MPDKKNLKGNQDRIRVDSKDPSEVEYVHSKHKNKSHKEVKKAVESGGPMRKNVEDKLRSKKK